MRAGEQPEREPMAEAELDRLLAGWSTRHGLSGARAEQIRRSILFEEGETSEELTREWWTRFSLRFRASLRRSVNAWRDPGRSTPRGATVSPSVTHAASRTEDAGAKRRCP
jgi:hypothetical protein